MTAVSFESANAKRIQLLVESAFGLRPPGVYRRQKQSINNCVQHRTYDPERCKRPHPADPLPVLKHPLLKQRLRERHDEAKDEDDPNPKAAKTEALDPSRHRPRITTPATKQTSSVGTFIANEVRTASAEK
jgi:hypothetical protein